MPNFIGLRARKFWVAVAARDAVEHLIHTGHYPTVHWNAIRLRKCLLTVHGRDMGGMEAPEIWWGLDQYIKMEESRDKRDLLAKLWPW